MDERFEERRGNQFVDVADSDREKIREWIATNILLTVQYKDERTRSWKR